MKKLLLGAAIATSLTGCATTATNYQPTVKQISLPELNKIETVNVGDKLLVQGNMVQQDAIYLPATQKVSSYSVQSGYYPKQGDDETYNQYTVSSERGAGSIVGSPFADPALALFVRKADNALCVQTIFNMVSSCKKDAQFSERNWTTANTNSFQQTLIYNGKVGSKINVGYREYNGDLARPAFSNEVEYDLNDSAQIGYKGALLEILNANNQEIKYKVLRNFNTK